MVREITLFQTADGRMFKGRAEAELHERSLDGHLDSLLPLADYVAGRLAGKGITTFSRVNNILYILCNVRLSDGSYLTEKIDRFNIWENGFYFSRGDLLNYTLEGSIYRRNGRDYREPERDVWFDRADEALSILENEYGRVFRLHWMKLAEYIRSTGLYTSCRPLLDIEGKSSTEIRRCVMEVLPRPCLDYLRTENEKSTDADYTMDDMLARL